MSDLISRQAATQTALEFIVEYLGGAFDEDFQRKLIERMNALPSAQSDLRQTCNKLATDCISRHAVSAWLDNIGHPKLADVVMDENRFPSAQPERKTGKWIFVRDEEAGNALYMCSECGKGDIHAPEVKVSYCWNCGADMRGEQDEAD